MEEHPLLNSVVLQEVFGYLKPTATLETVKVLRLVCSLWRDETLDWWRKEAVLKVDPEDKEGASDEQQLLKQLQDSDMFYRLEDKPFENLKLRNFTIKITNDFEEGTEANALWKLVGPHVKLLKLGPVNFETGGELVEQVSKLEHVPMFFLMNYFTSLKSLEAETINLDGKPMKRTSGDFLELKLPSVNFFKCTHFDYFRFQNLPNLRSLGIDDFCVLTKMVESMPTSDGGQTVIPSVEELSLDLHLDSSCDFGTIVLIRKLKFPALRRLKLSFQRMNRPDICYYALRLLMKNFSRQLEVLEVFIAPFVRPVNFISFFCQLSNLKELRVWGDAVQDMDFLMWAPRLKMLHLDMLCLGRMEEVKKTSQECGWNPCTNRSGRVVHAPYKSDTPLDNLEFLHMDGVKLKNLMELSWLMMWPKLKTFQGDLISGSISAICKNWPDLEHLVGLHGSDLSDEDIIGDETEAKGLSGFKHLQSFQYKPLCNKSRLTDAVVPVFMKMDLLRHLQICVSKQFSLEAEQSLKKWMGGKGIKIIRNYTGNEEHSGWQCCKEKE